MLKNGFTYTSLPGRVIFRAGAVEDVAAEAATLGCEQMLVLTTPQQAEDGARISALLGDRSAGVFSRATMHTPVSVTEEAMAVVNAKGVDGVVAFGGGSTIGLAKAIAYRTDLPQIAIATTYAGSEMTPILGQTDEGLKTTLRDMKVLPETVIYDVELTKTLPAWLSVVSGVNAMAHAVEALYAEDRNPVTSLMALEGIRALASGLPKIVADEGDEEGRGEAQYGAWLSASCLATVGMALHHKLCHTLGGTFDLPHAETHTIILPHAIAYNQPAEPAVMGQLAGVFGAESAAIGAFELISSLGAKTGLKELGMPEDGIEEAADLALKNAYWNPRPLEREALLRLLRAAWAGERPAVY